MSAIALLLGLGSAAALTRPIEVSTRCSRRAVALVPLAGVASLSYARQAKADALTDSFELSMCFNAISDGLEKWNAEVALMQLGQDGQLSKSAGKLSDAALKRLSEAGGEAGTAAGASYRKHSASMLTNLFLARGATKYETAAVAAKYMDATKADALLTLEDLRTLGAQSGVRLGAPRE